MLRVTLQHWVLGETRALPGEGNPLGEARLGDRVGDSDAAGKEGSQNKGRATVVYAGSNS